MTEEKRNEIYAVALIFAGTFLLLSLFSFEPKDLPAYTSSPNMPVKNMAGFIGAHTAGALFFTLGLASYLVPFLTFIWATGRFMHRSSQKIYMKAAGTLVLITSASSLISILSKNGDVGAFQGGGLVGMTLANVFLKYCGFHGSLVLLMALFTLSFILATNFLIIPLMVQIAKWLWKWIQNFKLPQIRMPKFESKPRNREIVSAGPRIRRMETPVKKAAGRPGPMSINGKAPVKDVEVKIHPKPQAASSSKASGTVKTVRGDYQLPQIDLLDTPPPVEERKIKEDLKVNSDILESTLLDFDVEAKVVRVEQGPVITRYELEPAPGVKVNRISTLSDDISLSMKAQSVRVVAPIPGKGTVGIEVPNASSSLVYLRDIIETKDFSQEVSKSSLPIILGKDIAGKPVIADLGSMPHLLIAGATGSGKTVCVNAIIVSLLYSMKPDELKFLMVDPKMVELTVYNSLPHLICPVITDAKKASASLNWLVSEMESRFRLLAKVGTKNIDGFNEKLGNNGGTLEDEAGNPIERMPYIVVVIDELADLMMTARDTIETAITRLAQLARAVGIHIILATQRPSVNVITGVIKANFPSRISFKVASKVDSRTVLDMNGADKLMGRGDMLFVEPGAHKPTRAQGALISDPEIERIVEFIKTQGEASYNDDIMNVQEKKGLGKTFEKDAVFEEAVKMVLQTKMASVSMLQRKLGVGYQRAARLIDALEEEGIVGPHRGSKSRDILVETDPTAQTNG